MRLAILIMPLFLLCATPLFADDKPMSQVDLDARAALALAKAKSTMLAVAAQTKAIRYADAVKLARKTSKPIFVSVGLSCAAVCSELRPEFLTCHENELEGSAKPRAVLLLPAGGSIWRVQEWITLPKATDVRKAAAGWRKTLPPGHARMPDAGDRSVMRAAEPAEPPDELVAALALGLVAVEPGEKFEVQAAPGGTVCIGGVCYQQMPSAGGPVTVQAPAAATGERFLARFPRLAAIRQGIRGAIGLRPPRIAGGFVSFAPAQEGLAAASVVSREGKAAGADRLDVIRRARATGISWDAILQLIVKYGLEAAIKVLQAILGGLGN